MNHATLAAIPSPQLLQDLSYLQFDMGLVMHYLLVFTETTYDCPIAYEGLHSTYKFSQDLPIFPSGEYRHIFIRIVLAFVRVASEELLVKCWLF